VGSACAAGGVLTPVDGAGGAGWGWRTARDRVRVKRVV
jgi:hypothetical protein